jgi:ABC-2 type transport system ATP-binding protein
MEEKLRMKGDFKMIGKMEQESKLNNLIQVESLKKSFGNVHAVNGVDFEIKPGEIFGLLGPNGAGKTTTIKLILGLIEADGGKISVLGMDPDKDAVKIKRRIGYISEEPLIYKSLTPRELFNFIASIRELEGEKVSKKLAEFLHSLNALEYYDRLIATLSRGNKQKVQIIAALLHEPDLLIMDEPLAGLDAKSVRVVKEIINIHVERGGAVIFSTHIMEVAEEICTRIGIINEGVIVAEGTIDELRLKADESDKSLEDIFLNLTNQDEAVDLAIANLRKTLTTENSTKTN